MNGDIYLGRVMGIPFRLHWSWFLAIFLISWTLASGFFPQTLPDYQAESTSYWLLGVLAALGLFVSVLLHELGHAVAARRYGIPVKGIRLFVFGGVAEIGGEPKKPSQEIVVALAGPAVTLLLIILYNAALSLTLSAAGLRWEVSEGVLSLEGGTFLSAGGAALLFYLGMINTIVLLFNMIPAFPLDGGRVLRGAIWGISGNYLNATRIAGGLGIAFAWFLFVMGFLSAFNGNLLGGVWLFFLGTFLQNAAQTSIAYAQLQQLLGGVQVAEVMRGEPLTLDGQLPLREVVDQFFLRHPYKAYPVVADGHFLGLLTLQTVQDIDREQWDTVRAADALARAPVLPVVGPRDPVLQAMRTFAETGQSRLAVVEDGKLVGLFCSRDVMDWLEIHGGLTTPGQDSLSSGTPPLMRSPGSSVRPTA